MITCKNGRTDDPAIALDLLNSVQNATNMNVKTENKLFRSMTANERIKNAMNMPIPKMLCGELWYEKEVAILFSDTNLGKTALAVQIADSISKGEPIHPFKLETRPEKTVYFDFEMSDKQFEKRYSKKYENHYSWSDNFITANQINYVDHIDYGFDSFETFLQYEIEREILSTGSKIVIIDNITFLKDKLEKADGAIPLMKFLHKLKIQHDLSFLILAHTPKRDESRPISVNDLGGSKHLANFCDSLFAIGRSQQGSEIRYLKQLKQRSCAELYGIENVPTFRLSQPDNFLEFSFLDFRHEHEHLKSKSNKNHEDIESDVMKIYKKNPELSVRKIADMVKTSKSTVDRIIKRNGKIVPINKGGYVSTD